MNRSRQADTCPSAPEISPRGIRCRRALLVTVLAALALLPQPARAQHPAPTHRIPLDPIGFQPLSKEFLLAGGSLLTVDYADQTHLLVTFTIHRLLQRDPEASPEDQDRTVGAYLLELPSGKVVGHTEWRLRDRGQYLWNLGRGHFLLRVRDRLTVLTPLASGSSDDPFAERPFLQVSRRIIAVQLSPDNLLTVQSTDPPSAAALAAARGQPPGTTPPEPEAPPNPAPVQLNFYRLTENPDSHLLTAQAAGVLRARSAVSLPITSAGYLEIIDGGRNQWIFNFDTHAGTKSELLQFDSTCFPRTSFVSSTEFVSFGCRGSAEKIDFAGFNLLGEQMWQQNFFEPHAFPSLSFAPAAGRFALSRTLLASTANPSSLDFTSQITSQDVRVYQTHSGKLLLHLEASPVERTGQNYAFAPDGLSLAVVRETTRTGSPRKDEPAIVRTTAIEIYPLPPLTLSDRAALAADQTAAPPATDAFIHLGGKAAARAAPASPASPPPPGPRPAPAAAPGADSAPPDPVPNPPPPPDPPPVPLPSTTPTKPPPNRNDLSDLRGREPGKCLGPGR